MGWIDLHMHSTYSDDGQYTPRELMGLCLDQGVRVAALADHNTTKGIPEAQAQALRTGITLIPAVELDCTCQAVNLHVLGYWIDPAHPGFLENEENILSQEQNAAEERIHLVCETGIRVDRPIVHKLSHLGVVTGEIIAEVALADPENEKNPLLLPYRPGESRSDNPYVNFYWDYCAQGKPAYVPIHYIALEDAVALIHAAGGIAVLAHPGNQVGEAADLLHTIVSHGIAGIEVYSSYHSPAQTAFYKEQTAKLHLAATCGSDFHGKTKPRIAIGSVDCGAMEALLMEGLLEKHKVVERQAIIQ